MFRPSFWRSVYRLYHRAWHTSSTNLFETWIAQIYSHTQTYSPRIMRLCAPRVRIFVQVAQYASIVILLLMILSSIIVLIFCSWGLGLPTLSAIGRKSWINPSPSQFCSNAFWTFLRMERITRISPMRLFFVDARQSGFALSDLRLNSNGYRSSAWVRKESLWFHLKSFYSRTSI